ncbi:hypothetical protein MG293_005237 [Ovis ammon polii]|uniref:BTB domain-containing protein n=2 Tax=Ovis TaxID=9935 RepID=A0A836CPI5_SHEEP|nr:hypothetical protein JEQ12_020486 [Ovis aries]KAI4544971.1 hypothetical protein MG293_005237 [Ovis ammon polii]
MSVSGKKEFDVKQILRLRWRWFSHPSQGSPNTGNCLQQEGYEHRGTPVQGRLKNHSRDRNGLKKSNSPVHHSILPPVPELAPAHQRAFQNWHSRKLIEHLRANEDTPKAVPWNLFKEAYEKHSQDVEMMADDNTEDSTAGLATQHAEDMSVSRFEEQFHAVNHAQQTLQKMENYLKEKQLCDVLLIAGHLRIPAHRLVLSAVSDYFAAMFTNDVLEAKQKEVKMEGIDPNALNSLVQYAYTGTHPLGSVLLSPGSGFNKWNNESRRWIHPSSRTSGSESIHCWPCKPLFTMATWALCDISKGPALPGPQSPGARADQRTRSHFLLPQESSRIENWNYAI